MEGILLELEGVVGKFPPLRGPEAPFFIEAVIAFKFEPVGVAEDRVILEKSMANGELGVLIGHEREARGNLGEIGFRKEGDLSLHRQVQPRKR